MYTEGIISRLNNPNLEKEDNPGRMIIDGCVGEYLENYDNHIYDLFLTRATGDYLDLHGSLYNIFRRENEDDESLRQRILTEELIIQSAEDFLALDVTLWVHFIGITDNSILSSRNPYLKKEATGSYVFMATGTDSDYVKDKFIVGDILWV